MFLHYPHSGTGRYLAQLVALAGRSAELVLLGARSFPPADDAPSSQKVRRLSTPFDGRSRNLAKIWLEQVGVPAAGRAAGADVLHVPYFAPPVVRRLPTVVTVHDLVPVLRPEYRRRAAQRLYTSLVALGLRSVTRVITDSRASAKDLIERLRVPRDRIRVIPLGIDGRFRPLASAAERVWAETVWSSHGVRQPYLLCLVGSMDRRKNVDRLMAAFARLKRERQVPHRLVVVGGRRGSADHFYDPRPDVARLGLGDSVVLIERVTDDESRALYGGAEAFVFPSLYEGFGLPPLEAMACGAPVVCSNASSLPEVVDDAALLFDPTDVDALVDALARIVTDPALRRRLAEASVPTAATFTWEATVRATVAVYREAAGGAR